ncbi:hypothetical protein LG195_18670 [Proteus terrae]|uniref:hypothetical protein n=1 Tax=Proteus terrae TaxID=1574161 RepID=UPI00207C6B02|nr:hypothetical protein [Proteus terrae]MCO4182461.1 hypothetical protein [Proteus terrae]MCO4191049.1 hypothetical protein [Proteus terrae]
MSIQGQLNEKQLKKLREQLKKLELPPKKRQRLLWRIAKYGVIASAKRNVKNQQTSDGEAWAERQGKWRKKMLRKMPKLLHIKEFPEKEAVRIYLQGGKYRNGDKAIPAGVVGYSQQHGMKATITKSNVKRDVDLSKKATPKQAKKLRALGYKVKKGKRWVKPPLKEITENMLFIYAGKKIKQLSGKKPKSSWTVEVPAREFLGISDEDFIKALERQLQGIGYGA